MKLPFLLLCFLFCNGLFAQNNSIPAFSSPLYNDHLSIYGADAGTTKIGYLAYLSTLSSDMGQGFEVQVSPIKNVGFEVEWAHRSERFNDALTTSFQYAKTFNRWAFASGATFHFPMKKAQSETDETITELAPFLSFAFLTRSKIVVQAKAQPFFQTKNGDAVGFATSTAVHYNIKSLSLGCELYGISKHDRFSLWFSPQIQKTIDKIIMGIGVRLPVASVEKIPVSVLGRMAFLIN